MIATTHDPDQIGCPVDFVSKEGITFGMVTDSTTFATYVVVVQCICDQLKDAEARGFQRADERYDDVVEADAPVVVVERAMEAVSKFLDDTEWSDVDPDAHREGLFLAIQSALLPEDGETNAGD